MITILLIVISFLTAHILFFLLPDVFGVWNAQIFDRFFIFRSGVEHLQPKYDDTVVHIDLNNSSIQALDNFYLSRIHHSQVIRNLSTMNVSQQAYDLIFAARSTEEEDQKLINATLEAGNVYFGMAFSLSKGEADPSNQFQEEKVKNYLQKSKWDIEVLGNPSQLYVASNPFITFSDLASVSMGLGYLSLKSDLDGVFRRLPLLVRYSGSFYPSFSLRIICDFLNVPPENILLRPGESLTLGDARRPGDKFGHDIMIPIDNHGNMVINFMGPWGSMTHYNYSDVLKASEDRDEMEMWGEEMSGKIAIIAETSTGTADIGPVPTDTHLPLAGLHANTINTILTESFLKEFTDVEMLLIEGLIMALLLLFSIRFTSLNFSLTALMVVVLYIGIAAILFLYGSLIIHIVRPVFMSVFAIGSIVIYRYVHEEKEKEVLRRSFEAYFPPLIVEKIMANPDMIASGGQKKELTILFSDIRNFTGYSSSMTPDHVQSLLNEYFEAMTEIVFKYEGTVDKFIGDGLMVFFGDPVPQPDHAIRCVRAAIDMQKKVNEIKKKWVKSGDLPIEIRIGISTGVVIVGNMGSSKRLSYTVLGSDVNLAQRLESNAPIGGILISERTHELIKGLVPTGPEKEIQAKGFDEPVCAYEILI